MNTGSIKFPTGMVIVRPAVEPQIRPPVPLPKAVRPQRASVNKAHRARQARKNTLKKK